MAPTVTSDVVSALEALDAVGVRWCIWKGSDHVAASLAGERDLDLLVDRDDLGAAQDALRCHGLVPTGPSRAGAPQDWVGLSTGEALAHAQLYDSLRIDDGFTVRWSLPWAGEVLDRRQRQDSGIWLADPADELVLLLASRAAGRWGRTAKRDAVRSRAARLHAVADHDHLRDLLRRFGGHDVASLVDAAARSGFDAEVADELDRAIVVALRGHEVTTTPGRAKGLAGALARRGRARVSRLGSRSTQRRGRHATSGGLVVAIVGADGSGKSSLCADLAATLGRKLDVRREYFGSGDGASSLLRWPAVVARRAVEARSSGVVVARDLDWDAIPLPSHKKLGAAKGLWALLLATEKRQKLSRARRAAAAGAIVVCDRFPQNQVTGFNDGPLLSPWRSSTLLLRSLARWERRAYEMAAAAPPDLVLHLEVSPDVAAARRPEHDPDDLRRRIAAVASLRFDGSRHGVVAIDADRTQAEVRRSGLAAILAIL